MEILMIIMGAVLIGITAWGIISIFEIKSNISKIREELMSIESKSREGPNLDKFKDKNGLFVRSGHRE